MPSHLGLITECQNEKRLHRPLQSGKISVYIKRCVIRITNQTKGKNLNGIHKQLLVERECMVNYSSMLPANRPYNSSAAVMIPKV